MHRRLLGRDALSASRRLRRHRGRPEGGSGWAPRRRRPRHAPEVGQAELQLLAGLVAGDVVGGRAPLVLGGDTGVSRGSPNGMHVGVRGETGGMEEGKGGNGGTRRGTAKGGGGSRKSGGEIGGNRGGK